MAPNADQMLGELRDKKEADGPLFKIKDDPRIIPGVGKLIRKHSIDELPQLINVFVGNMSVVGPRPALPNEVATYNDYQRQRLLVKPGMTCYWQTRRNRDSITFDEWVDLDLWNKERNGDLKPTDVIANSNKRVWWKCREGHEWSGLIANRARRGEADPGCPYCSGRKVLAGYNDLATTHPGIAAMRHPRMNRRLRPTGVQAVSRKFAWWRGECGHVYQMAVRDRVRAKPGYCPYCSGRKRPEGPIRLD